MRLDSGECQRHVRGRHQPADEAAGQISALGPDDPAHDVPDEAQTRKEKDEGPERTGSDAAERAVGSLREQRQDDEGHDAEADTASQVDVVNLRGQRMQAALLHQQQHLDGDDAARKPHRAHAGEDAGRHDDQSGDLRRAVDVLPGRDDVRRYRDCDRTAQEDCRERGPAGHPEPPGDAGQRPQHGEGPNASKPGGRPVGVARTLTFQADGRSAKSGNDQTDDVGGGHWRRGRMGSSGMPRQQILRDSRGDDAGSF